MYYSLSPFVLTFLTVVEYQRHHLLIAFTRCRRAPQGMICNFLVGLQAINLTLEQTL